MGKSLSLDAIKQQFNLPENATVAEVKQVAEANNIVIDFSKNQNNTQQLNNPSGSILEDSSTSSSSATTKFSSTSGTTLSGGSVFGASSSLGGSANNNSVFGYGSTGTTTLSDGLTFNKPALETQTLSNLTSSGQTKTLKDYEEDSKSKFSLKMPKIDLFKGLTTEKVDKFLDESMSEESIEKMQKQMGSMLVDSDSSKVLKTEYSADGKSMTKFLEDGSKVEVALSEEEQKARSELKDKARVVSTTYEDGKAIMKMANGKTYERPAIKGERGYQKTGNSVEEELRAKYGDEAVDKAIADGTKGDLIKKYVNEDFLKLSKDERLKKFKELFTNTDGSTEEGKYLMSLSLGLGKKVKATMQAHTIQSRTSAKAQQEVAQEAVRLNLGASAETPEEEKDNITTAAEFAKDYAATETYNEAAAQNVSRISADNTQYLVSTGIAMDPSSASQNFAKVDMTKLNDGQASGIHTAFTEKIKDGTITAEQKDDTAQVLVGTETAVQDVERQRDLIKERNDAIKDANEEIRDAVLDTQGQNGHKYHKDNQVYADTSAREIDENGVYNRSVADNVQNYDDKDIQDTIAQRVVDSKDEQALNNLAKHVYEFDESNRDKYVTQLKNSGYESVNQTLKESKTNYENSSKSRTESTKEQTRSTVSDNSNSSSTTTVKADSTAVINKIVSSVTMNTTEKAKQVKTLSPKEQQVAVNKLLANATMPEIKGLVLSGLKSEVFNYLLDNFAENKSTLDSLKGFMTSKDLARYESLLKDNEEEAELLGDDKKAKAYEMQIKKNFFVS